MIKNRIFVIDIAILVIALIVVLFVLPESTQNEAVIVPDCENLKVSACEKKLQKLGFVVETDIEVIESFVPFMESDPSFKEKVLRNSATVNSIFKKINSFEKEKKEK